MPATVSILLEKNEPALAECVRELGQEEIQGIFTELWDRVRQTTHYAGQARSSSSSDALSLSRLALAIATRREGEAFRSEAHRMMAFVLNAHEQFEESLYHYTEALRLMELEGAFAKAARARIGFVAALFMTGRYSEAMEEARRADAWFL